MKNKNVDILAALQKVVQKNTEHFQSDFDYDVQTFERAAQSKVPEEKVFYWMSRKSGT